MVDTNEQSVHFILDKVGRSSTPDVPTSPFGLTLGQLIGDAAFAKKHGTVLFLGGNDLRGFLNERVETRPAVPGLLGEQSDDARFSHLIIDTAAFAAGPWLGSDSGAFRELSEEIFEAGRVFRATGRIVILLRRPDFSPGEAFARIESTATCTFDNIPGIDFEEGARQSKLWISLQDFVKSQKG